MRICPPFLWGGIQETKAPKATTWGFCEHLKCTQGRKNTRRKYHCLASSFSFFLLNAQKSQKYLSDGETVGIITKETPAPSGYENVEKQHFREWEKQT